MSNFLISSSVGRKFIMSISGVFLVLFLIFHMSMNITAIFSEEAFNIIAGFLGANWYAIVGTLVLALGFAVHIIYATILTLQNRKARGAQRYAVTVRDKEVSWSSKNMFVLGLIILGGLVLHLYNFWYNMQAVELLGGHVNSMGFNPSDGAALIRELFSQPVFCIIYLLWFTAIWLHLTHGMWSMFQTVGLANKIWFPRLKAMANVFSTIIMLCFAAIVVVFYIKSI